MADARKELGAISQRLAVAFPATNAGWEVSILPLTESVVGPSFPTAIWILLGGVALVLLVAWANVALLLLVRNTGRARELTIRMALGAGRARLARLLIIEGVAVGLAASVAGIAVAHELIALLHARNPTNIPRGADVRLDGLVIAVAVGLALAAGVVLGTLPGGGTVGASLAAALRQGGRSLTEHRRTVRARGSLVVAQVALAVVVLAAAGVLFRSLIELQTADLGFDPVGVQVVRFALPAADYPDRRRILQFHQALLDRTGRLPGVQAAALVSTPPLLGPNTASTFTVVGRPIPPPGAVPDADYRSASVDYWSTLRIPILEGRGITAADDSTGPRVALVNRTLARRFWPGGGAVGSRIRLGDVTSGPEAEIVGVVADHRYWKIDDPDPRPLIYFPLARTADAEVSLVVRTAGDPGSVAQLIRAEVKALDPGLPIASSRSLLGVVTDSVATNRFMVLIAGVLAAAILGLAGSGLYGVMAATVAEGAKEIGVRMALGAERRRIVGLVLGRAMAVTIAGVGLGLVGAVALNRALTGFLYQVEPADARTLVLTGVALGAVALLGAALPARRAIRLDPIITLRAE